MPSKTSVIPVNPQLLPQTAEEMERCARTVYVANVDHAVREEEIRGFFTAAAGAVARMHLRGNPRNNTKVAFVEFESLESVAAALSCAGHMIRSRALRVSPSKTPLRINHNHNNGGGYGYGYGGGYGGGGGGQPSARIPGFTRISGGAAGGGGGGPQPGHEHWVGSYGNSEEGSVDPRLSSASTMSFESFDSGGFAGGFDGPRGWGGHQHHHQGPRFSGGSGSSRGSRGRGGGGGGGGGQCGQTVRAGGGGGGRRGIDPKMWHNVHVRNISSSLSESALARVFAGCGRILDCRLCGDPNSKLRFAFIAFATSKEVDQALTLDGFMLEGAALRVLRSKTAVIPVNPNLLPQSEDDIERCSRTVYVANVDPHLSPAEVRATFEELCGPVTCMHQQLNNRRDTQVAFIEFAEASSATTALGCSGQLIGQRQVRVSPSKTPLKVNARTSTASRGKPEGNGDGGGHEDKEEEEGGNREVGEAVVVTARETQEAELVGAAEAEARAEEEEEEEPGGARGGGVGVGGEEDGAGAENGSSPTLITSSSPSSGSPAGQPGPADVVGPMKKLSVCNEDPLTETAVA